MNAHPLRSSQAKRTCPGVPWRDLNLCRVATHAYLTLPFVMRACDFFDFFVFCA